MKLEAKDRLQAATFSKEDFKPGQRWLCRYDYDVKSLTTKKECTIDKVKSRGCAITWQNGATTWEAPFSWFVEKISD